MTQSSNELFIFEFYESSREHGEPFPLVSVSCWLFKIFLTLGCIYRSDTALHFSSLRACTETPETKRKTRARCVFSEQGKGMKYAKCIANSPR